MEKKIKILYRLYSIFNSTSFDDFLKNMGNIGCTIKYGKHISFRYKGMDKNIRAKVLGENYTEESIRNRIAIDNKLLPQIPVLEHNRPKENINGLSLKQRIEYVKNKPIQDNNGIKKLIDITNNEKYQNELYYQKFVRRYNTDQMIKVDNFMRKQGYTEQNIDEIISSIKEQIKLDMQKLREIKGNFNVLNQMKANYDKQEDIKNAFKDLMNLEKETLDRLEKNKSKLSELSLISKNLKIYKENQIKTMKGKKR